jgi:hypothetical protein
MRNFLRRFLPVAAIAGMLAAPVMYAQRGGGGQTKGKRKGGKKGGAKKGGGKQSPTRKKGGN